MGRRRFQDGRRVLGTFHHQNSEEQMTPREMLELAARAAGKSVMFSVEEPDLSPRCVGTWDIWNPLQDDGDTQRLLVTMRFVVQVCRTVTHVTDEDGKHLCSRAHRPHGDDAHAATRYAVTRAAAETVRGVK